MQWTKASTKQFLRKIQIHEKPSGSTQGKDWQIASGAFLIQTAEQGKNSFLSLVYGDKGEVQKIHRDLQIDKGVELELEEYYWREGNWFNPLRFRSISISLILSFKHHSLKATKYDSQ